MRKEHYSAITEASTVLLPIFPSKEKTKGIQFNILYQMANEQADAIHKQIMGKRIPFTPDPEKGIRENYFLTAKWLVRDFFQTHIGHVSKLVKGIIDKGKRSK